MIRERMAIQRQRALEGTKPKVETDDTGPAGLELMPLIGQTKRQPVAVKAAKSKPVQARAKRKK
jgi:hypothetical protein